jgi:glycosyltransferase involved in cell wall biosynthesis
MIIKKKICFIVSTPATIDAFLLEHFKKLGQFYEITVVSYFPSGYNYKDKFIDEIYNLKIVRDISLLFDVISLIKLAFFLKRFQFNSVHSITPKAGLLAMLASFFAGVEIRIHTFTGQVWHTKSGVLRFLLMQADMIVAFCATHIIVDGNSQLKYLVKHNILDEKKAIVFGNGSISGVDLNKFKFNPIVKLEYRRKLSFNSDDIVFGYLGRLNKEKGVLDLIHAFNSLSNFINNIRLIIIGPDEENIISKFNNSNSKIIFLGKVDKPENYLQCIDVFCMPSYREGFGTSVIEASSLGIPVLCSDTYGLSDAFVNDSTGLKYRVADLVDLEAKMLLFAKDKSIREKFGYNGRKYVESNFSSFIISQSWVDYYNKLFN